MKTFLRRYLGIDALLDALLINARAEEIGHQIIKQSVADLLPKITDLQTKIEAVAAGLSDNYSAHSNSFSSIRFEIQSLRNELENLRMQTTDHAHTLGLIHSHQLGDVSYVPRACPSTK